MCAKSTLTNHTHDSRVRRRWHVMSTALLASLLTVLLQGCGAPAAPQPPQLSLERVELVSLGVREQRFALRLQVENPNAIPLPLEQLGYRLSLDNTLLGRGSSDRSLRIAAGGRETLELELTVDSIGLLGQLSEWSRSPPDRVSYLLEAEMQLGPWPRPLQISHEGQADLRIRTGAFGF